MVRTSVGSTNDELRRLAEGGAPPGTALVADHQHAGRGRRARVWHSPPGLGAYVSVLFRPARPPGEAARWTLAAAVAAAGACREATGADVAIEWPNDLVCGERKLGGILAELRSAGGAMRDLVVGAGVNVLQREQDFPPELRGRATSLQLLAPGRGLRREPLIAGWLGRLRELDARLERGDWAPVAAAWSALAPAAEGRHVRVRPGDGSAAPYAGITRGLAADGALRVERSDGALVAVRLVDSLTYGEP